jgi:hypothetical protein
VLARGQPECHTLDMREKELRLALICYGGVSLAIYMHGVTREIWHMVRASRAFHDGVQPSRSSETVYRADDKFEMVNLERKDVTYSYFADPFYVFMDTDYNQFEIDPDSMGRGE